jgi:hypothetical protein
MCSIRLDPCREDHTICTAVAFDAVRTVRTYATDEGYGPGLVHKLWPAKPFQPSKHGTTLTRPRSNDRSQVVAARAVPDAALPALAVGPQSGPAALSLVVAQVGADPRHEETGYTRPARSWPEGSRSAG